MTRHVVVGTAGHIDHGKTSLVKALTGIDTDRLPEEKARGITIDLGFAFLEEPGGLTIEIVDVPGHERFVRNMLAGVGGIDLAMLVIAADEGVMPQTREHLAICSLLKIKAGLIALTKADLVESDWLELVREDVAGVVHGTFLEDAPILPVSAKTGQGLGELRAALRSLAGSVPPRGTDQFPRLPIDRVFTVKGFGTVVTGTLTEGTLAADDRVEVYPRGAEARFEVFRPTVTRWPPRGRDSVPRSTCRDSSGPRSRGAMSSACPVRSFPRRSSTGRSSSCLTRHAP